MVDIASLIIAFQQKFGAQPRVFRAPGRVNLLGEHTDYNGGYVLPMAIDRGTCVAIAARPDRVLNVWSMNLQDSRELDLDQLGSGRHGEWLDYVEGIAAAISDLGIALSGANIALYSDVPIGGGLSSSAALEISLAKALVAISGRSLDGLSLAMAGQKAEHRHVGIDCGIMDQYTSVFALKGCAILLDCRSLEAKNVPLNLQEYQIVVCDSQVRHALAASQYNHRRQECNAGVERLKSAFPEIKSLRDLSLCELEAGQSILTPVVMRRCRHVISENARTIKAADALASGNLEEMGRLMLDSHDSLKKDYEVSCRELDVLVDIAKAQPGVLGSRMTGGGFGGCTVNLVARRCVPDFRKVVSREYHGSIGIRPDILIADPGPGAEEIFTQSLSQDHYSR